MLGNKPFLRGFSDHEGGYDSPLKFDLSSDCYENDLANLEDFAFFKDPFQLKLINSNQLKMIFLNDSEIYRKTKSQHHELRKILFKGKYKDKLGGRSVNFLSSGRIDGIPSRNYFQLLFDFGEGLDFDAVFISFDSSQRETDIYHFRIEQNTIKLYEVNGDIPNYTIGKLRYELVKQ